MITQITPLVLEAVIAGAIVLTSLLLGYISRSNIKGKTETHPLWTPCLSATIKLYLAGLVMLGASYLISFTVAASILNGRDARVHAAAIVGASLITGTLLEQLMALLKNNPVRFIVVPLLAAYMAFFVGFGFVVQNEYRLAWSYEKRFWSDLLPQIQDAGENKITLVAACSIPETTQIGANTWNVPRVLEQLFVFPSSWAAPPRVYRLLPNWQESILTEDGKITLQITNVEAPPSLYGEFDPSQIIFVGSEMHRESGPLNINGTTINIAAPGEPVLDTYPKAILYHLLFD
ncbi:MAG: hypothetical protein JW704_09115 [Anaerolineaceae bacterium]|nr:hypothetical protein [Anaerolineaceae bacterium]